jgi:hypothetical protein
MVPSLGFNCKLVGGMIVCWSESEPVQVYEGSMGLTEPSSGDLGWIEKELFYGECKYYQRFFQISLLT